MTKKKTRKSDSGLHLWNVIDLWEAVKPCLLLKDDAELAAQLRRHFIEIVFQLAHDRRAEMTAWSKEESEFLQSVLALTEGLRKKIADATRNAAEARVLQRLALLMKLKVTKEEFDVLVGGGSLSIERANELWSIWAWPPADLNDRPIREFTDSLVRIRRGADVLLGLPKRKSKGQSKLARDNAIKGFWDIWQKSPAGARSTDAAKTPTAFLSFIDSISQKLPSDLRLGSRQQVRDIINRKRLLGSATGLMGRKGP
jgi:hypothetical protein